MLFRKRKKKTALPVEQRGAAPICSDRVLLSLPAAPHEDPRGIRLHEGHLRVQLHQPPAHPHLHRWPTHQEAAEPVSGRSRLVRARWVLPEKSRASRGRESSGDLVTLKLLSDLALFKTGRSHVAGPVTSLWVAPCLVHHPVSVAQRKHSAPRA